MYRMMRSVDDRFVQPVYKIVSAEARRKENGYTSRKPRDRYTGPEKRQPSSQPRSDGVSVGARGQNSMRHRASEAAKQAVADGLNGHRATGAAVRRRGPRMCHV